MNITNLQPGGSDGKIQKLPNLLEIRVPVITTGTFIGADRKDPKTGKIVKQEKIEYPSHVIEQLTKSALALQGDVEHSHQKYDVVSFVKEIDFTNPNVGYATVVIWKPWMIKAIQEGRYGGISMEADIQAVFDKEKGHFVATSGKMMGYAHVDVPAVEQATIETMRTIQLSNGKTIRVMLSHKIVDELSPEETIKEKDAEIVRLRKAFSDLHDIYMKMMTR